ncbi:hypothetical protein [Devosia sediminis]|uniref:DUF1496 domain-containing protein n=1 Tax=Devosia sediminis TaxID=2798801 RepID=A0A934ML94_9HYPH|nr:hypothetical protein [Devosia sediminis]MBJ3784411.1 hypothetical protein [Devosia sediminis]
MRCAAGFGFGLLLMLASPTVAQEASLRETRCWVGDVVFSAGMSVSVGDDVAVCEAGTGWRIAGSNVAVAGCVLEGEFSSVGAVVGIRNSDDMLLQCDPRGHWVTIEAD